LPLLSRRPDQPDSSAPYNTKPEPAKPLINLVKQAGQMSGISGQLLSTELLAK
jgi:hypothetical protein